MPWASASSANDLVPVVAVERDELVVDVADGHVRPAVPVVVGGVDAHARARPPFGGEGDRRPRRATSSHRPPPRFIHRWFGDVSFVTKRSIRPVAVEVGGHHPERLPERAADGARAAHVPEAAVPLVPEERARQRRKMRGHAEVALAVGGAAARGRGVEAVADVAADEQVEQAVVVVVEEDGARRPARHRDAGLLGDVGERSVAFVVVEDRLAVGRDVEVGGAVVVVVADRRPHPVGPARHTGLSGDVGERPVPVVPVERVREGTLGR